MLNYHCRYVACEKNYSPLQHQNAKFTFTNFAWIRGFCTCFIGKIYKIRRKCFIKLSSCLTICFSKNIKQKVASFYNKPEGPYTFYKTSRPRPFYNVKAFYKKSNFTIYDIFTVGITFQLQNIPWFARSC